MGMEDERVAQLEHRMNQLEVNMQQQQHVAASQHAEVQQQLNQVRIQVDQQGASFQSLMDQRFTEQLSEIERIMAKRPKTTEWRYGLAMHQLSHWSWLKPTLNANATEPNPKNCQASKNVPRKPGPLWLLMLILFTILRIGEAAHPGPNTELVVGCANANNLLSKADAISKLPAGLWGFSETCLTTGGIEHFQKALKAQKPSQLRYLPGAPAPRTSTNLASIGGKHVGVGFCTHLPARPLTNDWPDELWQTGRLQTIGAFAGQWIKGGIVYGFAKDCHTPKVIAQTSELLKAITQRVVLQSHGPRFLMGDSTWKQIRLNWHHFGRNEVLLKLKLLLTISGANSRKRPAKGVPSKTPFSYPVIPWNVAFCEKCARWQHLVQRPCTALCYLASDRSNWESPALEETPPHSLGPIAWRLPYRCWVASAAQGAWFLCRILATCGIPPGWPDHAREQ